MIKDDFENQYNPKTRCYVTYKNVHDYTLRGLLLDNITTSTNGNLFCYVDNFYNRIPLENIESLEDTGIEWIKN